MEMLVLMSQLDFSSVGSCQVAFNSMIFLKIQYISSLANKPNYYDARGVSCLFLSIRGVPKVLGFMFSLNKFAELFIGNKFFESSSRGFARVSVILVFISSFTLLGRFEIFSFAKLFRSLVEEAPFTALKRSL